MVENNYDHSQGILVRSCSHAAQQNVNNQDCLVLLIKSKYLLHTIWIFELNYRYSFI
jgi:hypothetical protein